MFKFSSDWRTNLPTSSAQDHGQPQTVGLPLSAALQDLPPPVDLQHGLLVLTRAGQRGLTELTAEVLGPEGGGGGEPGAPGGADRPAGQHLPGLLQVEQDEGEGDGVGQRELGPVSRVRHLSLSLSVCL